MSRTIFSLAIRAALALFISLNAAVTFAQESASRTGTAAAQASDAKAEQVIKRAVEAMGGRNYLDVRTVVSRGNYSPYIDGIAGLPIRFVDYLAFPDRERTEFSGSTIKSIQTNVGDGGWIHDLRSKKITDVTPEAVKEFRLTIRTSLDNLLRGWWHEEGAELSYLGRREAGVGRRNEAVRLTYPDGFAVEFEFAAHDGMPAKARFKRETREGDVVEEEERYAQFINVGGVRAPFVVDRFRAGIQSSRVNFEEIKFNAPIPDSLFARPTEVKAK